MVSCMTTSFKASKAHACMVVVCYGTRSLIIGGENNALTWFYLLDTPSPRTSATIWCNAYSYYSVCTSVMLKQYFINFKWEEVKMKGKDWQKGEEKVFPPSCFLSFFWLLLWFVFEIRTAAETDPSVACVCVCVSLRCLAVGKLCCQVGLPLSPQQGKYQARTMWRLTLSDLQQ